MSDSRDIKVVEVIGTKTIVVSKERGFSGNGKSAYEIALEHGFVGTEQEWLDSLQGSDGTNGGQYTHTQGVPSAFWTINHNLGYRPNIYIFDSTNDEVKGDISHIDNNSLTVSFSAAFSGGAYLS